MYDGRGSAVREAHAIQTHTSRKHTHTYKHTLTHIHQEHTHINTLTHTSKTHTHKHTHSHTCMQYKVKRVRAYMLRRVFKWERMSN